MSDDQRTPWPPEMIELSIMTEVHRLAFIFRYIVSERPAGGQQGYRQDDVHMVAHTIASFEPVLTEARLPRAMDETLRTVIRTFRASPGPLPPDLAEAFHERVLECLLRDLAEVPGHEHAYRQRIARLSARGWIGEAADVIPQGWLPIVERVVRIGETSIEPEAFADVRTSFMGEKFGRLDWTFNGHRDRLAPMLDFVRTATSVACMSCARPGQGDQGPADGRILKLCGEHMDLRMADGTAFRQALYPGGPPDHPLVKLY